MQKKRKATKKEVARNFSRKLSRRTRDIWENKTSKRKIKAAFFSKIVLTTEVVRISNFSLRTNPSLRSPFKNRSNTSSSSSNQKLSKAWRRVALN